MEGKNISEEIAFKRDVFLQAEREYLEALKKDKENERLIEMYNRMDPVLIYKYAKGLVEEIEMGRVKEKDLERVEKKITILFASIEDFVREKIRERVSDDEEMEL